MAAPGVIRICIFCQILLFGFLNAQPSRYPLYGSRRLRYQWPPETPPPSRARISNGRGQFQRMTSSHQRQRNRIADFNNNYDFNDQGMFYDGLRTPTSNQNRRRPFYQQDVRLPARTTLRGNWQTQPRLVSNQAPVTYTFNQYRRQLRVPDQSFITRPSAGHTGSPARRSRFESVPFERTPPVYSPSSVSELQRTPSVYSPSSVSELQRTPVLSDRSLSTTNIRSRVPTSSLRHSSRRTFYNSRPRSNPTVQNTGQQIVTRHSVQKQSTTGQSARRQSATRQSVPKQSIRRESISRQSIPKDSISRQPPQREPKLDQSPGLIPTSGRLHDVNVAAIQMHAAGQTVDSVDIARVSPITGQSKTPHHDILSSRTSRLSSRATVTRPDLAHRQVSSRPAHHGSSIHGPRVATLLLDSSIQVPRLADTRQTNIQKQTIHSVQEQTQHLVRSRPVKVQHTLGIINPLQSKQKQQTQELVQLPVQKPIKHQPVGLIQPFVEVRPHVQPVPQPQQPHAQSVPQHSQPHEQSVPQHSQPHVQSVPQHSQPHVQSVPQHSQPHVQSVPQHSQPHVQSVPQHSQPHVQSLPQHSQPHVQSIPQHSQPHVQSVPQHSQPHVQSVPQHSQPHVQSVPKHPQLPQPLSQDVLQQSLTEQQQPQSHVSAFPALQTHIVNKNPELTGQISVHAPAQTKIQAAVQSPANAQTQVAVGATKTLHDELVEALVAALEGRLSAPSTFQSAAAPALAPAQTPVHTHATHGFMQAHQLPWGSQSPYGHLQQMYPAHLYPAYMQEMMFGDTQDPPDPTQPTPNVTTAIPDLTTSIPDVTALSSKSEPVTLADTYSSTTQVSDTTTEYLPVDTTTEALTLETSTLDIYPDTTSVSQSEAVNIEPITTDIPMPSEQKGKTAVKIDSKILTKEIADIHATEKIQTMFKAAQSLQGKLSDATRIKLLTGIRDVIKRSNVDLASLKSTLNKQVAALKSSMSHDSVPSTITDAPPPARDTTLAATTINMPEHRHTETTTTIDLPHTTKKIKPSVDKVVEVRSLIDTGTSTDAGVLQSILKEIAMQSKGKHTLPKELNNVNFRNIADSLVPKGTDLATQLADPNFIKLLREIVSKLHSFVQAPEVTTHLPEMTTYPGLSTTTGEYEI